MSKQYLGVGAAMFALVFMGAGCVPENTAPASSAETSVPAADSPSVSAEAVAPAEQPQADAASDAVMAVKEFTIVGNNFSFAPTVMTVKKGDRVKITLDNVQGFHDFKIDEFNVASKKINAGEKDIVEFVADKIGTFEYYCSVGSHRAMGMKGMLTVEE